MLEDPWPLAAGVRVTLQFGADPEKTILVSGKRVGFELDADRLAAHVRALSISLITTAMGPATESSSII
jgi:hypothetical protein